MATGRRCHRGLRRAAASKKASAAGVRPPVIFAVSYSFPMAVTRLWRVGKVRLFAPHFYQRQINQGGAAEPGAVVTQFPAAAPAVKGAGCTSDRRGYTRTLGKAAKCLSEAG